MAEHSEITDPNIHEPKGAATAPAGSVYISDGDGSGSWSFLEPANADQQVENKVYVTNGSGGAWEYIPQGWASYVDAATTPATQTISTTPSKLQVDGGGANTVTDYLPAAIRDTGALWSVADDKITPIGVGDSYAARVTFTVTATSGSPTYVILELDIGGDTSPTVVISIIPTPVYKTAPYDITISFPFYSLDTFVTNGGQIFLSTNSGTVTIGARAIVISRTSGGNF